MVLAIVIASVAVLSLAVAFSAWAVRRARRSADERVAEAVRRLGEGMEATMRELAEAVSAAHAAGRQAGFPGGPAELDFEEVAARALGAASAVPGIDGAMLETLSPTAAIVSSAVGVGADQRRLADLELPTDPGLRSARVAYRFRPGRQAGDGEPHVGVLVPLRVDGDRIGTLSAFSHSPGRGLDEVAAEELETLGQRTAPALWNAKRFAEARAQADLDPLTGLHNRRYFHELLGREVARAHRYRRRLSLLLLDVETSVVTDAVLVELAGLLTAAARSADVPCRIGDGAFAVILPEAEQGGPKLLARRLADAFSRVQSRRGNPAAVTVGAADLQPGDGAAELLERARANRATTAPPGAAAADSR